MNLDSSKVKAKEVCRGALEWQSAGVVSVEDKNSEWSWMASKSAESRWDLIRESLSAVADWGQAGDVPVGGGLEGKSSSSLMA